MASKPKPTNPTPPSSAEPVALADDRPVTGQRTRHDGWTAERQRPFPTGLAIGKASGPHSPHHASSPRSADPSLRRLDLDE